jgi:hypothetical protein
MPPRRDGTLVESWPDLRQSYAQAVLLVGLA